MVTVLTLFTVGEVVQHVSLDIQSSIIRHLSFKMTNVKDDILESIGIPVERAYEKLSDMKHSVQDEVQVLTEEGEELI